ncbi:MAG: hypothetical protein KDN19_07635 [Verrucomicrobiae bacterium]|nr:hypothetical protein [Verrucomicrobiae bacterium]
MRKLELGKRSHVARGGRLLAGGAFVVLGIGAVLASQELGAHGWIFFGVALVGLLALMLWRAEDKEELDAEDLIEVAREAIHNEAARLDRKRLDLEKRVLAYGEWMEFPDFEELREADWTAIARSEQDERVARLLASESDAMLARFSDGTYFDSGKFQAKLLLLDIYTFVEAVSKIYQPGSERPLLETNLESLLKAINRASLQVILLLEELPLIEVKELNLRKVSEGVRKANKVYRKYEELQPFLEPVRYLWQGSKFLLTSNPLLAAGWIAGTELIWKGGKHIGKKALDAYLLSLVRQSLGIIAWETASIYDRSHRYRNPDWVFAVELAHLVSQFELTGETLRETFQEIGKIPLKSSYDRIFLYRCVAQHVSPKPERFAQADLMAETTREQIQTRLEAFYSSHLSGSRGKEVEKWRNGMKSRLGLKKERVEADFDGA